MLILFTASWRRRGHPTNPSVQQPHAEQRRVSVLFIYLTTVFWSRGHAIPTQTHHAGIAAVHCDAFNVLLVAADPNLWTQHVNRCNSCPLLGIYIYSYCEHGSYICIYAAWHRLHRDLQHPCHSVWARLWNADVHPEHCASKWSSPVLFVDRGGFHSAALHGQLFKVTLKSCLLWKWKWYY